jgi:hypothetical protein
MLSDPVVIEEWAIFLHYGDMDQPYYVTYSTKYIIKFTMEHEANTKKGMSSILQ